MDNLNGNIGALHHALTAARHYDLDRLAYALDHASVVGVHGEPEVGKTTLIEAALRSRSLPAIRIELAAVTEEQDAAVMLAKGLVRWVLAVDHGSTGPSLATLELPDELRPSTASRIRAQLGHEIGSDLVNLAVRNEPGVETVTINDALYAVSRAAERRSTKPPVLWFDHLEAPGLTPRHPVDVAKLLWDVRSQTQVSGLPVVLSGSKAVSEIAYGKRGAYYGDGAWVTLDRPGPSVWEDVAQRSGVAPPAWGQALATLTDGHPSTTLIGLASRPELDGDPSPMDVWEHLVALENGLTSRALQYARQSHRLGGHVLLTIAAGDGPYAGVPDQASRKEIHKVVQRLHRAGLVTQPMPRTWSITNPIVAVGLSGRPRREHRTRLVREPNSR